MQILYTEIAKTVPGVWHFLKDSIGSDFFYPLKDHCRSGSKYFLFPTISLTEISC